MARVVMLTGFSCSLKILSGDRATFASDSEVDYFVLHLYEIVDWLVGSFETFDSRPYLKPSYPGSMMTVNYHY